ncbi:hypothetical protein SAY87_025999 [Trapa incisa]|uniref:Uncharacterized protein n=1 Tax=Trapa incisa TaxID=236973 RepID=A0AAN7JJX0_9MYRT|nr:hypothetical protein SAY87_025999 [Trapa incisa]
MRRKLRTQELLFSDSEGYVARISGGQLYTASARAQINGRNKQSNPKVSHRLTTHRYRSNPRARDDFGSDAAVESNGGDLVFFTEPENRGPLTESGTVYILRTLSDKILLSIVQYAVELGDRQWPDCLISSWLRFQEPYISFPRFRSVSFSWYCIL